MKRDYAYYAEALGRRALPAAYVDLDLFDENARALVKRAAGKPIRVASKSLRANALIQRVLGSDDGYRGVLAFNALEAVFLAEKGHRDVLVGYPVVDPGALTAVARAIRQGAELTLMVDSREHVERTAAIARAEGVTVPLCIDVDMSVTFPGLHFGVRRSPLRTPRDVLSVAETIRREAGVRLEGLMGYEAQLAGVPDAAPGARAKNAILQVLKRGARAEVERRRGEIVRALRDAGFQLRFVNGGGTGSLESTSADASVTEVAAGSGLYSPLLFDGYSAFRHHPAAGFALQITRLPAPKIFTCQSGGYIASGASGPDRLPRPVFPAGASLLPLEGAGEVQTPVEYSGPVPLALGSPVFFRHAKAGELCEHFASLLLISAGRVVDEVPTYRGEGRTFA